MVADPKILHEVLWVSEEEMYNLTREHPDLAGVPQYVSVDRHGNVRFWPHLDPEKHTVMITPRWGG